MDTNKSTKLDYDYENLFDTAISNLEEKEISDYWNKQNRSSLRTKTFKVEISLKLELYPVFSKKEMNKYRIKEKTIKSL